MARVLSGARGSGRGGERTSAHSPRARSSAARTARAARCSAAAAEAGSDQCSADTVCWTCVIGSRASGPHRVQLLSAQHGIQRLPCTQSPCTRALDLEACLQLQARGSGGRARVDYVRDEQRAQERALVAIHRVQVAAAGLARRRSVKLELRGTASSTM